MLRLLLLALDLLQQPLPFTLYLLDCLDYLLLGTTDICDISYEFFTGFLVFFVCGNHCLQHRMVHLFVVRGYLRHHIFLEVFKHLFKLMLFNNPYRGESLRIRGSSTVFSNRRLLLRAFRNGTHLLRPLLRLFVLVLRLVFVGED